MKNKKSYVIILITIFSFLILFNTAYSSWIGLSTDELIEQADIILIGKIQGIAGERPMDTVPEIKEIEDTWVTDWQVKVLYYLKGNETAEKITVVTPGSETQHLRFTISIDYRLDLFGNNVLLFLKRRKGDGFYEPITPQGIVPVEFDNSMFDTNNTLSGEGILKQISPLEKNLQEFIQNTKIVLPTNEAKTGMIKSANNYLISLFIGLCLIIVGGLFIKRKYHGKQAV